MNKRQGFIGGSDVKQILDGNLMDLWEVKTGLKVSDDLSNVLPVQMGITTEELNLDWFSKNTGKKVTHKQKFFSRIIDGVPFKGTIDGFVEEDNSIVEAKHTNSNSNMRKVLSYYNPQVQLYCGLSGATGGHLTVFFGSNVWETKYVVFDHLLFENIVQKTKLFWWHVSYNIKPEIKKEWWEV